MSMIRLHNICKTYQIGDISVPVLTDVSLTVERQFSGERLADCDQ